MAYLRLPPGCRPAEVVSKDQSRPNLTCAMLEAVPAEAGGPPDWRINGTDGFIAARLHLSRYDDDQPEPFPGPIPRQALQAIQRNNLKNVGGGFHATEEYIRLLDRNGRSTGILFERKQGHGWKLPDLAPLIAQTEEDKDSLQIGVNAVLLHRVAEGLGSDAVALTINGPLKPIGVRPYNARRTTDPGLVMPLRLLA